MELFWTGFSLAYCNIYPELDFPPSTIARICILSAYHLFIKKPYHTLHTSPLNQNLLLRPTGTQGAETPTAPPAAGAAAKAGEGVVGLASELAPLGTEARSPEARSPEVRSPSSSKGTEYAVDLDGDREGDRGGDREGDRRGAVPDATSAGEGAEIGAEVAEMQSPEMPSS